MSEYDQYVPTQAKQAAKAADRDVGKLVKKVTTPVGNALAYGHKHPLESVMNVLGAPQRGLEALETGADIGHSIMTPSTQPALSKGVKTKIGLQGLEDNQLAGNDLGHKVARGALDFGVDLVNDPLNLLPVGKIAKFAGKAVPGVAKLAEGVGSKLAETGIGKSFRSEVGLENLTEKGKATVQAIQNRANDAVKNLAEKEDAVVRAHADEIRAGTMPSDVAKLFRKSGNVPTLKKGSRPQEVIEALAKDRQPVKFQQMNRELRNAGLLQQSKGHVKVNLKNPGDFFKDPATIADAQKSVGRYVNPRSKGPQNFAIQAARKATRLGNKAFLANPIPHTGNLANLAFNEYGPLTTLKGLANAGRLATGTVGKGKLASDVDELSKLGAHSEYRNIFDELGLTRIAGIPGTELGAKAANLALIPAQRAANFAQKKILNTTETGLRAAALNAEKKAGRDGVLAARNIHRTFGTGPRSKIVQDVADLGTPFAQFHLQTAPGSGLRTLINKPGRFVAPLKAQRDLNAQVNPNGPNYVPTTPTFATAKAIADPLSYFTNLGPLGALHNPYGVIEQLKRGPKGVEKVVDETAGKYVPFSQELGALHDMLVQKHGRAGEQAFNDLVASIVGGYYAKK